MKWMNVRLIFSREVRDQLRDRRTIFTVAILPLLLYPLIGTVFMQVGQFMQEHKTRVRLLGTGSLPETPRLLDADGERFSEDVCPEEEAKLLIVESHRDLPHAYLDEKVAAVAEREIQADKVDAVVYFPPGFAQKLAHAQDGTPSAAESPAVPEPVIYCNTARDKSRSAGQRIEQVLRRWREKMVEQRLAQNNIPVTATKPFKLANTDVAPEQTRRAAFWSKILTLVAVIWALTGAFYPAVDLCAGEKERGTLETLLSCPALRSEIVCGKLLTVMVFSIATSLLNLASMGFTGLLFARQAQSFNAQVAAMLGPPPLLAMGWLVLALIPISMLFSALALALAAFARSTKEGQYYLMPLLLVMLPLMTLPLLPTTQLDLGTALIPVSGMMLLLRSLIEGQWIDALRFGVPVVGVTAICCLLSIRWAVDQFSNESVLFRETERWGLGLWFRNLVRDRGETPSFAEALLCGVILLMIQFFANMTARFGGLTIESFTGIVLVSQVALIATPALLMTIMLTTSPRQTLSLQLPRPLAVPAAIALAVCLHPAMTWLSKGIQRLYPISEQTKAALGPLSEMLQTMPLPLVLLLIAVTPAICEELAFRGFILSGLRHSGHKWLAIVLSSVFFGVTHGVLQQSLAASVVGVVLGYLCVQSGSLFPGVCYHLTHNGLSVLSSRISAETVERFPVLQWLVLEPGTEQFAYSVPVAIAGGVLACGLLHWFRSLPHREYQEEQLQEALDHQTLSVAPRVSS